MDFDRHAPSERSAVDGAALGDQKRVATPAAALSDGADHIVVGRPIYAAPDPVEAAAAILAELP